MLSVQVILSIILLVFILSLVEHKWGERVATMTFICIAGLCLALFIAFSPGG